MNFVTPSQSPNDNTPKEEEEEDKKPLNMEVAMNKSMSNHLIIANVVAKKIQLGKEVFCDHVTTILHKVYVKLWTYEDLCTSCEPHYWCHSPECCIWKGWWWHPKYQKNKMNNWVEKYASTNRDSRLVSFHFILELWNLSKNNC